MRFVGPALLIAVLATPLFAADPVCTAGPVWNYCTCGDCAVNGPANWAKIGSPECSGKLITQSPVSLAKSTYKDLGRLVLNYEPTGLAMANTGRAVKMMPAAPEFITLKGGPRFDLQELHFHVPAEHKLAGVNAVAELHLVHENPKEPVPIAVGVFLILDEQDNPQLNSLIAAAATIPMCAKKTTPASVKLQDLVPQSLASSFLEYQGSLTTPVCTRVHWLVLRTPIRISKSQLAKLNLFGANSRPDPGMQAAVSCWPAGPNCKQ
jgi:carbonic anhydrase